MVHVKSDLRGHEWPLNMSSFSTRCWCSTLFPQVRTPSHLRTSNVHILSCIPCVVSRCTRHSFASHIDDDRLLLCTTGPLASGWCTKRLHPMHLIQPHKVYVTWLSLEFESQSNFFLAKYIYTNEEFDYFIYTILVSLKQNRKCTVKWQYMSNVPSTQPQSLHAKRYRVHLQNILSFFTIHSSDGDFICDAYEEAWEHQPVKQQQKSFLATFS